SSDRDIQSEWSARSARRWRRRSAPSEVSARRRHPGSPVGGRITAVDGVPVVDEVLGPTAPGRRLQELMPDPGSDRTGGDVAVAVTVAVRTFVLGSCGT